MNDEHLYMVAYDIADPKRWRALFRLMKGYGEWLQLSVFQCRLNHMRHAEMLQNIESILNQAEDHALIIDIGLADAVRPRVHSIGKQRFDPIERAPIIV
jgi:CRISPR-associated protein Cas2